MSKDVYDWMKNLYQRHKSILKKNINEEIK